MQDEGFARSARMRVIESKKKGVGHEVVEEDVLGVGNDARLDATLFARLGKSQLPPRPPRLLLLKPSMFRRA